MNENSFMQMLLAEQMKREEKCGIRKPTFKQQVCCGYASAPDEFWDNNEEDE